MRYVGKSIPRNDGYDKATGRGLFVLCHTSNPEGEEVQFATHGGHTIAQGVVDHAQAENTEHGLDDMGLVIGATHDNAGVDLSGFTGWTLAPGIGAQGGTVEGLSAIFGASAHHVLPSSSRGVLRAGPDRQALQEAARALILH